MLQPVELDLNAVLADMKKMLRRLIGEDVELVANLEPELARVEADPGQVEQVLGRDSGIDLIQKPFKPAALLEMVREVLDRKPVLVRGAA